MMNHVHRVSLFLTRFEFVNYKQFGVFVDVHGNFPIIIMSTENVLLQISNCGSNDIQDGYISAPVFQSLFV